MADLERFGRWTHLFPFRKPVDRVAFVAPDGSEITRETFQYQRAELTYDDHGYEHLTPKGREMQAVRFTPSQEGMYRYQAFSGEQLMEEGGFRCVPSDHPGYVMFSLQMPQYFTYTNGAGFCPIGLCMAGPPMYRLPKGMEHFETGTETATLGAAEYERWFRKLAENGGNFARIWLSHPYFNVETEIAGELDIAAFARLDAVVEHARTYGIRLKLCFDHFRTFEPGTPFSKTLRHPEDGRTPADINEWLSEPTWRELWLKKVKAYTLRYGGDPTVMSWELWNEMDCVEGDFDLVLSWTEDMLKELKKLSPQQLITNSMGSLDDEAKLENHQALKIFGMDFQQVHRYLDQGAPWAICREDPVLLTFDAVKRTRRRDRPTLLAETGAVNDRHTGPFRYYRMDDRGIILHDTTFPAFFAGAAGVGQIWHWDRYVDQKDLWHLYKPFADMVADLDMEFETFIPVDLSNEKVWCLVLRGRGHILAWVRNRQDTWQNVLRDGNEPGMIGPQTFDFTSLNLAEGNVELFWPFGDAPDAGVAQVGAEASLADSTLTLPPFRYGLMVKIGPPKRKS